MVLRKSGEARPRRHAIPQSTRSPMELAAFADAIERKQPFPVPEADVLATLAAFEAALQSMRTGHPVVCHMAYQ